MALRVEIMSFSTRCYFKEAIKYLAVALTIMLPKTVKLSFLGRGLGMKGREGGT